MSSLQLSPAQVAAFAHYREALELSRRFGNIARFRARALRQKLKPLGLVRCGDRFPHLGSGEFEGVVLTPPIVETDATGMGPEFSGLIVFGGVCLRDGLVHRAGLKNADVPELQVGMLLRPLARLWPQISALLSDTLAGLEAEGFEVHELEALADDQAQEILDQLDAGGPLSEREAGQAADAEAEDADFDSVDVDDPETEEWVDIEDGEDGEDEEDGEDTVPGGLLLLRRLSLDRLPEDCGPIVTRFFNSALAPLLAISDFEWKLLILSRDQTGELGEEE